ncbi:hypothetical protein ABTY96_46695 [Streptomyces sp. NPDC096057]|uniref:hypothetical protein n=1 Tax=Streptomyces sp. NPDC096057 TaxID=3155543 RepID=UPI003325111E
MTAPPTPRPASPANMPHRAPAPAPPRVQTHPVETPPARDASTPAVSGPNRGPAEEAIAPGRLTKAEHFRKYFLFGLRDSRMHSHARLVGHDLMWRASHSTGRISPNMFPRLEALAQATGLTTGQVEVALAILASRGWITSRVLQEGPRAGSPAFTLTIPAAALQRIRDHAGSHRSQLSR